MKIEINVDERAEDLKISVTCKQLTPEVEKLLATLRMMDHQLTARKDNEIYFLGRAAFFSCTFSCAFIISIGFKNGKKVWP